MTGNSGKSAPRQNNPLCSSTGHHKPPYEPLLITLLKINVSKDFHHWIQYDFVHKVILTPTYQLCEIATVASLFELQPFVI